MKTAFRELVEHIPFTAIGSITGILIMVLVTLMRLPATVSSIIFYILHPAHVLLSAIVTTALYRRYGKGNALVAAVIGYAGSVLTGTLSDSVMPYLGGLLLRIPMEFHAPFVEAGGGAIVPVPEWAIVNGVAVIGVLIGYFKPKTHFPHATHVLLSTWATLFNFTAFGVANWIPLLFPIFIFLFISVWLPCCFSDIVFPLMWGAKEPIEH